MLLPSFRSFPLAGAAFIAASALPAYADDRSKTSGWSVEPSAIEYHAPEQGIRLLFDGYVQMDGILPLRPDSAQEDAEFRRIRPTIRGELGEHVSFKLMSNFSKGYHELQDAYLTYTFNDAFAISGGKMKVPMGLELLQSSSDMQFINRSLVSELLPGREYGFMADGKLGDGRWEYAAGIFTNVAEDEVTDDEDWYNQTFAARIMYSPVEKLQFGIAADFGSRDGSLYRPRLIVPESAGGGAALSHLANIYSDGDVWRITPQLHWYEGPFQLMTEYAHISQGLTNAATGEQGRVDMFGGHISLGYFLTGEDATYNHPVPLRDFNPLGNGWGAWELTGRIAYLDTSDAADSGFVNRAASADGIVAGTAGVNWHLNAYAKLLLNYEYAYFTSADMPEEQSVMTRLQLEF